MILEVEGRRTQQSSDGVEIVDQEERREFRSRFLQRRTYRASEKLLLRRSWDE